MKKLFFCFIVASMFIGGFAYAEEAPKTTTKASDVPASSQSFFDSVLKQTNQSAGETFTVDKTGTNTNPLGTVQPVVQAMIAVLGIIAVVLLVYAGYLWMTAGGNDQQIDKAKGIIRNVVIGLIIVTSAWLIVSFILSLAPEPPPRRPRRIS